MKMFDFNHSKERISQLYRVVDIKDHLKLLGLNTQGNKAELVDRIFYHYHKDVNARGPQRRGASTSTPVPGGLAPQMEEHIDSSAWESDNSSDMDQDSPDPGGTLHPPDEETVSGDEAGLVIHDSDHQGAGDPGADGREEHRQEVGQDYGDYGEEFELEDEPNVEVDVWAKMRRLKNLFLFIIQGAEFRHPERVLHDLQGVQQEAYGIADDIMDPIA